jgi:RHS repeat-associated protein
MKESNTTHLIDRGFTGHQHLDVFELINMNGRMFDPVVQQFLSPDPYVQMPDNPLNFNRYAYCLFNPLKYIDPSGMLFGDYRDRFNNYLGNDGINDGKVYIVTDAIDVAKIQLNNIFHKTTPLSEVRSAIDLQISQDLRWEILSKSITFDTPENLQEWGGVARQHQLEDGSLYDYINWGERGPVWQGNPHNAYFFFSTARGKGQGLVFFHLHFQGRKDGIRAIQTPSEIDFNNVREDPARRNALNLVISVQDNAVHIMHNNNTWTTMSFGSFWGAKNIYTPKQY